MGTFVCLKNSDHHSFLVMIKCELGVGADEGGAEAVSSVVRVDIEAGEHVSVGPIGLDEGGWFFRRINLTPLIPLSIETERGKMYPQGVGDGVILRVGCDEDVLLVEDSLEKLFGFLDVIEIGEGLGF